MTSLRCDSDSGACSVVGSSGRLSSSSFSSSPKKAWEHLVASHSSSWKKDGVSKPIVTAVHCEQWPCTWQQGFPELCEEGQRPVLHDRDLESIALINSKASHGLLVAMQVLFCDNFPESTTLRP